jgi:hypothetical protein
MSCPLGLGHLVHRFKKVSKCIHHHEVKVHLLVTCNVFASTFPLKTFLAYDVAAATAAAIAIAAAIAVAVAVAACAFSNIGGATPVVAVVSVV